MGSARGHEITIEQSTTPAGWYNDPAGSGGKRWWDGVQWTAHMQAAAPPTPPPAAMVLHQPQQLEPQRVDPYGQSNPYGYGAVQQRAYVPMQQSTLPPVPMQQVHDAHNNAAIGSVVVGALAFCLSLVGVIPGAPIFYYSAGGILAIIGGVRALVRSRMGYGTNRVLPVVAIVLGSLAVLFMIIGIAIHATTYTNVLNGTSNSQLQSGTGSGASSGSTSEDIPVAPTFATDSVLTGYEATTWVVVSSIYTASNNHRASTGAGALPWPTSLSEDATGKVVFDSGTTAAGVPSDEDVKYELSSDGDHFAVAVSGGDDQEVALYDSESNTFTWICDTGAPADCPAGGLDPGSSGSSTLNS